MLDDTIHRAVEAWYNELVNGDDGLPIPPSDDDWELYLTLHSPVNDGLPSQGNYYLVDHKKHLVYWQRPLEVQEISQTTDTAMQPGDIG